MILFLHSVDNQLIMKTILSCIVLFLTRYALIADTNVHTLSAYVYLGEEEDFHVFTTLMFFWYQNNAIIATPGIPTNVTNGAFTVTQMVDDINGPCYTFTLFVSSALLLPVSQFKPTAFTLSMDNVTISLLNQTHDSVTSGNFVYNASIDFCSTMFRDSSPQRMDSTNTIINILRITFENYPSNLILKISDFENDNEIYYKNVFGETTQDSSKYDYFNNTVTFPNMKNGCFNIYMIDPWYQDIDIDSSLNHVRYVIYLNNKTIKYGGYYSDVEITSFCTNSTNTVCLHPKECQNVTIDDAHMVQGWGYQSYYGAIVSMDINPLNFYGANSFQNGKIIPLTQADYNVKWNCEGAFSCYNMNTIHHYSNNWQANCNGWHSCSRSSGRYQTEFYNAYDFYWYVIVYTHTHNEINMFLLL